MEFLVGRFQTTREDDVEHSNPVIDHPPAGRATAWAVTLLILFASTLLLFSRLGHYALWDDEAITVMTAKSVWRTGDTSAVVADHNLLAYRDGLLLRHLKDRYTPPLQFYLLAPVVGLLGDSSLVCRVPFAICGLLTVVVLLRWLWRVHPPALVWWAAALALMSNAEFFLFFRQARYYGLATLLTAAAGYCYAFLGPRRRSVALLSIVLGVLLTAQYLSYAGVIAALAVDYFLWGRRRRPLDRGDWLLLLLPQLVVGGIIGSIWNPLAAPARAVATHGWGATHAILLWWSWRDLIGSDFVIVPLLLCCPLLYGYGRQTALLRLPLALAVFVGAMAVLAATPVIRGGNAEVRYLSPATTLCVGIAVAAAWGTLSLKPGIRWAMLVISAASLLLGTAPDEDRPAFGATSIDFVRELVHPQQEPYTPTIHWLNSHLAAGASVMVQPPWMAYPLMLRCPQLTFAWQLIDPPTRPEYRGLADIHFAGRVAPDYLVAFGPYTKEMSEAVGPLAVRGIHYHLIATIPVSWKDRYRPEIIWRSFVSAPPSPGNEVYVFQRDR